MSIDLVRIGISVLRVDPEKEKQISAAREWALDLIDTNADGVKFSPEARAQLIKGPLGLVDYSQPIDYGTYSYSQLSPPRPSAEPPK